MERILLITGLVVIAVFTSCLAAYWIVMIIDEHAENLERIKAKQLENAEKSAELQKR